MSKSSDPEETRKLDPPRPDKGTVALVSTRQGASGLDHQEKKEQRCWYHPAEFKARSPWEQSTGLGGEVDGPGGCALMPRPLKLMLRGACLCSEDAGCQSWLAESSVRGRGSIDIHFWNTEV